MHSEQRGVGRIKISELPSSDNLNPLANEILKETCQGESRTIDFRRADFFHKSLSPAQAVQIKRIGFFEFEVDQIQYRKFTHRGAIISMKSPFVSVF